ncbi:MAG: oligosaccharide flippase family protein, partial [Minisyncoccia bacterium]
ITLRFLGEADARSRTNVDQAECIMQNIFTLRFFSAAFFYGLAFVISLFFPYPTIVKLGILILSLSLFFSTLVQILSAFYQKILKTEKIVFGELFGRLILLILIILFVKFNLGFYWILATFIFGSGVNFLFLWLSAKHWIILKFKFDWSIWRRIFSQVWPIGLATILNAIYFKADTLILSFYYPAVEVGVYGACYRVFEVLITFPPLFLGLITPRISTAWAAQNIEQLKILLQKSFDFLTMIIWPMIFMTLVLGPRIMELIGGPEFIRSGEILRVIILATGVLFIAELFKQTAVSLNQQRFILWFYLMITILALVGYFVFIPQYSYWGAAWMTVAAETLMFIFTLLTVWRTTKFLPKLNFFWKSFQSSLIVFFVLLFLQNWNLFILIGLAILVYFVSLYLLRGISKEMLKEIIKWT